VSCDFTQLLAVPRGWPEDYMSVKRKWLKALLMLMMAGASFMGPMNPREIEELMYIMNETRIEFTIPDADDKGGGKND
jgi:hypothetical protein